MQNSLSAYTKKYDDLNYGLSFPDGHIVRFLRVRVISALVWI